MHFGSVQVKPAEILRELETGTTLGAMVIGPATKQLPVARAYSAQISSADRPVVGDVASKTTGVSLRRKLA